MNTFVFHNKITVNLIGLRWVSMSMNNYAHTKPYYVQIKYKGDLINVEFEKESDAILLYQRIQDALKETQKNKL